MKVLLFTALIAGLNSSPSDGQSRYARQALPEPYAEKWENNTLYYYYDELPYEMRAMFRDAFEYLGSHTCLNFVRNETAAYTVRIHGGPGCYSQFGMVTDEPQEISFDYGCAAFGVAVHETMHALGIAHGQSRSDRDDYLVVDSSDHNDDLKPQTINYVPFDYGSVMLYSREEWRYPKDPEYNYTMGSLRVAFYDMIMLNRFYDCNCDNHPTKLDCKNGGYQNPANCDECLCTDGFGGELCDTMEGVVLPATTEWQAYRLKLKAMKGIQETTKPPNLFIHITAPQGSTIEVRVVELAGFFCHETCDWNGVELKYKPDRRITSPLICCDDDNLWNKTRSSTNNPFVVVEYGDFRTHSFSFEYRYLPGNSTAGTK